MLAVFAAGTSASAMAETDWAKHHPRRHEVNKRLNNQNRRIHQRVRTEERIHLKRHFVLIVGVLACVIALPAPAAELTGQQRALHVLNRLAYGPRPGDVAQVMRMGVDQYIDEQLHPERIVLPASLNRQLANLSAIKKSDRDLIAEFRDAAKEAKQDPERGKQERRELVKQIALQTAAARLSRAIDSPRQLEEVMVDFWFNHFNVFEGKGLDRVLIAGYEREAIRPHVLGRFRDLLGATATHPAMLFYLDNWQSTAPGFKPLFRGGNKQAPSGLNENYARELMELHTLGVDGGYTQKDVTELARILTGWTFDPREGSFRFAERRHDQGDKTWMGHSINANGQAEGEFALDELAKSPATARHISYKLAQYFVADQPPPHLVEQLARRFTQSGGDIRAVLNTLFHSPEFWDPANYGGKFKTPYQYVLSALRASDAHVVNYLPVLGALRQLGMPLYGCQTPDGYKNTQEAWLNPDALTRRINFATALAAGRLALSTIPDRDNAHAMEQAKNFTPVDAKVLAATLDGLLSEQTRASVAAADSRLQSALMLGSPDFMHH